jgi:hypothetical protein
MSEPIPITLDMLPQLLMELTQAGDRGVLIEEADGVQYITARSRPGERWLLTDAASEPTSKDPGFPDLPYVAGPQRPSDLPAALVVEIHFPLVPTPGLSDDEYQYPWIMEIEERVGALELDSDGAEMYDVSEGLGRDDYLYFLTGPDLDAVLSAAKMIATGPDVPPGAFVVVNQAGGDMGDGQRLELSDIA